MVTSPPSTTELENQAKVKKKALLVKNLFCRIVFHLRLLKCRASKLPYLNIPISKLISREVPKPDVVYTWLPF